MQHFQAFLAPFKGRADTPSTFKVVEYVRFNPGKAGFCRRRIVGFNGKRDVLVLHKPVVPFGS